jgi:hypothetical protein
VSRSLDRQIDTSSQHCKNKFEAHCWRSTETPPNAITSAIRHGERDSNYARTIVLSPSIRDSSGCRCTPGQPRPSTLGWLFLFPLASAERQQARKANRWLRQILLAAALPLGKARIQESELSRTRNKEGKVLKLASAKRKNEAPIHHIMRPVCSAKLLIGAKSETSQSRHDRHPDRQRRQGNTHFQLAKTEVAALQKYQRHASGKNLQDVRALVVAKQRDPCTSRKDSTKSRQRGLRTEHKQRR